MPTERDIDALIARAQSGELRAFETLIAAHMPVLRRFARAFAANDGDADDLAQEALIKVYKSIRLFRYQSAFSTWLFAISRNVFLDAARSRLGHERAREDSLQPEHTRALTADGNPDALLAQEEERQRVWRALRQLPVEYRTAIVLFDIEGRSYDEVSAIEGVPMGTVKSRLARGRTQLKALLEDRSEALETELSLASSHMRGSRS